MTYSLSGSHYDVSGECVDDRGIPKFQIRNLIHQAVDDGAQLIVLAVPYADLGFDVGFMMQDIKDYYKWAFAHAMARGVPVVASVGDEPLDLSLRSYSLFSGVVGVTNISTDGQLTARSSWSQHTVTASVGANINARVYPDKNVEKVECLSCAPAITAGFLALAREKWPQATSNQLLQLLIRLLKH